MSEQVPITGTITVTPASRWAAFSDDELAAISTMEPGASEARLDDVIFALSEEIRAELKRRPEKHS